MNYIIKLKKLLKILMNIIEIATERLNSGANGHYMEIIANHLDDKENALRIVHQKCIPLIDEKDHHNNLIKSMCLKLFKH